MSQPFDYALVGGGLQNGLIALAVRTWQPEARIALIERGPAPGGNHTWCFHADDVPPSMAAWVDPLVVNRWSGYDVAFAEHTRRLELPYARVTSERLARDVTRALSIPGSTVLTEAVATAVTPNRVEVGFADGTTRTLYARAVVDARGPDRLANDAGGWQKFVGQELELARPHGLERPIVMDARVPQRDGFRFFYVLPLDRDRVLIEDTYFSDTSHLDVSALRGELASYAETRGWKPVRVVREESGILPMPVSVPTPSTTSPLIAGYAGGWFHPTTAYSFPIAARLADHIARRSPERLFDRELASLARDHGIQLAFATRLNRMLFRWFSPERRHHVLARFYRLPEGLISRFYALQLTGFDRARVFVGRPPRGMSLRAALGAAR